MAPQASARVGGFGSPASFESEWGRGVDDHDRQWDGGPAGVYAAAYVLSYQQRDNCWSDDSYECDGAASFVVGRQSP
jgi:hypothetical protein